MSQPDHNMEGHEIKMEGDETKMEGHEAMMKDEKQDIILSEESAQIQDDDNASGFETRAQRMQHMPKVISLQIPPNGSDRQGGADFWYCPQNECREKFSNAKDRNDHAHWNHGWCWKCSIEFKTQKALQLHYRTVLHPGCK